MRRSLEVFNQSEDFDSRISHESNFLPHHGYPIHRRSQGPEGRCWQMPIMGMLTTRLSSRNHSVQFGTHVTVDELANC